jgi:hypothetical protein
MAIQAGAGPSTEAASTPLPTGLLPKQQHALILGTLTLNSRHAPSTPLQSVRVAAAALRQTRAFESSAMPGFVC